MCALNFDIFLIFSPLQRWQVIQQFLRKLAYSQFVVIILYFYCTCDLRKLHQKIKKALKDVWNIFSCFLIFTAQKTIFSFSKYSEKMVFPKKLHWDIFLLSSGKMAFFSWKCDIFSRRKVKDDLSQKIHDILCILGEDGDSFSYKHEITLLSKKQRLSTPKKYT